MLNIYNCRDSEHSVISVLHCFTLKYYTLKNTQKLLINKKTPSNFEIYIKFWSKKAKSIFLFNTPIIFFYLQHKVWKRSLDW